jgi:hypothetical protein
VPDGWQESPDDLDMYILSPGRDSECLADGRNRQSTLIPTYFYLRIHLEWAVFIIHVNYVKCFGPQHYVFDGGVQN